MAATSELPLSIYCVEIKKFIRMENNLNVLFSSFSEHGTEDFDKHYSIVEEIFDNLFNESTN